MMFRKIYVIGSLKSGKSFFANKLSEKLKINFYNLDDIFWLDIGVKERPIDDKNKILDEIKNNDSWIIEGAYTEQWVIPFVKEAELIILLKSFTLDGFSAMPISS